MTDRQRARGTVAFAPADVAPELHETGDDEEADQADERVDTSHLDDVEDGCGCAEVWEHLSENRDAEAADD